MSFPFQSDIFLFLWPAHIENQASTAIAAVLRFCASWEAIHQDQLASRRWNFVPSPPWVTERRPARYWMKQMTLCLLHLAMENYNFHYLWKSSEVIYKWAIFHRAATLNNHEGKTRDLLRFFHTHKETLLKTCSKRQYMSAFWGMQLYWSTGAIPKM